MDAIDLILNADEFRKLTDQLTDIEIDRILVYLKVKEIEEQIRSNKVIEGVLFDIHAAIAESKEKE